MTEHLKYARLVLDGAFGEFAWGRDLTIGLLMNFATLGLSYYLGLISTGEWNEHKWLFILVILLPYVVILFFHILWRIIKSASNLHSNQLEELAIVKRSEANLAQKLQEIEDTKPNIVLCDPGAEKLELISLNQTDRSVNYQFAHVRFVNSPQGHFPSSVATGVRAYLKFFDLSGTMVLPMDGRWSASTMPSAKRYGETRNDLLPMNFGIGEAQDLDIAFWDHSAKTWIAWNNDNFNFPNARKPEHVLNGNQFVVEIRLAAVWVDKTFAFRLFVDSNGPNIHRM